MLAEQEELIPPDAPRAQTQRRQNEAAVAANRLGCMQHVASQITMEASSAGSTEQRSTGGVVLREERKALDSSSEEAASQRDSRCWTHCLH